MFTSIMRAWHPRPLSCEKQFQHNYHYLRYSIHYITYPPCHYFVSYYYIVGCNDITHLYRLHEETQQHYLKNNTEFHWRLWTIFLHMTIHSIFLYFLKIVISLGLFTQLILSYEMFSDIFECNPQYTSILNFSWNYDWNMVERRYLLQVN